MDAGVRPSIAQPPGQLAGPAAQIDHRSWLVGTDPVDKVEERSGALIAVVQVLGGIPSHGRIVPPDDGGAPANPWKNPGETRENKGPERLPGRGSGSCPGSLSISSFSWRLLHRKGEISQTIGELCRSGGTCAQRRLTPWFWAI